ncbi:hypothetical protein N9C06_07040 [Salibacteraceae bacterium]|jgi:hypothetical protein|nr:hypothetical protein [Salibacteraceae bacterium]
MRLSLSLFLLIYCSANQLFSQSLAYDLLIQKNGDEVRGQFIRFEDERAVFVTFSGDSLRVPFQGIAKIMKSASTENQGTSPDDSPRGHLRGKFENSISLNILSSVPPGSNVPIGGFFNSAGTSLMLGMGYRINPHIYFGLQTSFESMNVQALPFLAEVKLNLNKRKFSPFIILGSGYYQEVWGLGLLFDTGVPAVGFKGLTTRNGLGFDLLVTSSATLSFTLTHRYYDLTSNFDSWNNQVVTKAQLNRLAFGIGLQF